MTAYASVVDYGDWLTPTPPPDDAQRRLDRARIVVDEMLLTAVYAVDTGGTPTDADTLAAVKLANCAQAEYQATNGDPLAVGAARYHSMTIGSINLTRAYGGTGSSAPGRWSPTAWAILQQAGLTASEPWTP